ncbi:MAG: hypothetical protein JXR76_19360 [Deltaproteobacteria bacterium]|nr:hypothetical protein [Deltaproteobacteria bacterium]
MSSDTHFSTDVDTGQFCSTHQYIQCHNGDAYWFNACNAPEEVIAVCEGEHVICANQTETTAECKCAAGFFPHAGGCAPVLYVNAASAATVPDGRSWETSYGSLSTALTNAAAITLSEGYCFVFVAGGTYIPSGDRNATFALAPGIHLYGGFSGSETSLEERESFVDFPSILSGDLGEDTILENNVYHVVTGSSDATLDGFVVTGGFADGDGRNSHGAGMYNQNASVTVRNCRFEYNFTGNGKDGEENASSGAADGVSSGHGAGMYNLGGSPQVMNTVFEGNKTGDGGNAASSNITFEGRTPMGGSGGNGGGMYNENSTTTVSGCHFINNSTGDGGSSAKGSYSLTQSGGGKGGNGAGLYAQGFAEITVVDSIFKANKTGKGGNGASQIKDTSAVCGDGGQGGAGGGIAAEANTRLYIYGTQITANETGTGGIVPVPGDDVTILCSPGDGGDGAGVLADQADTIYIADSILENNKTATGADGSLYASPGGDGGGLSCVSVQNIELINSKFILNKTGNGGTGDIPVNVGGSGGAVAVKKSSIFIANSTFSQNKTGNGGEMISQAYFSVGGSGGALFFNEVNGTIANSIFTGNTTGTGMLLGHTGAGAVLDFGANGQLRITSCTIVDNYIEKSPGDTDYILSAIRINPNSTLVEITNSIVWGTHGSIDTIEIDGPAYIFNSCVENGDNHNGNINTDPNLDADLRPSVASNCIDAGNNAFLPADRLDFDDDKDTEEALPFDLDWGIRIVNGNVDIGAYEYP